MSIFYDVQTKPFLVRDVVDLDDLPAGVTASGNGFVLEWHDEGFTLEEVESFLKKAKGKNKMTVHLSDHEGATSYDVFFGDGNCFEEGTGSWQKLSKSISKRSVKRSKTTSPRKS